MNVSDHDAIELMFRTPSVTEAIDYASRMIPWIMACIDPITIVGTFKTPGEIGVRDVLFIESGESKPSRMSVWFDTDTGQLYGEI